jgi:hypothetical protein
MRDDDRRITSRATPRPRMSMIRRTCLHVRSAASSNGRRGSAANEDPVHRRRDPDRMVLWRQSGARPGCLQGRPDAQDVDEGMEKRPTTWAHGCAIVCASSAPTRSWSRTNMNRAARRTPPLARRNASCTARIYGIAGIFGLKVHNPVVGSIRTAMCGRSTGPVAASELIGLTDGQKKRLRRQRTKEMVLARCHQLGLLPADCMDFDIADAALQWGYWASRYGDREGTELYLFAE